MRTENEDRIESEDEGSIHRNYEPIYLAARQTKQEHS